MIERDGFILDREPKFFTEHTADELRALGYSDKQLAGIRECLSKRNLFFKGESAPKALAIALPLPEDEPVISPKPDRRR